MQRDKQIGLALAVLLTGTVGAFFFRNEPVVLSEVPELHEPHLLDHEIAEQAVIPYLGGIEVEQSRESRARDAAFDSKSPVQADHSATVANDAISDQIASLPRSDAQPLGNSQPTDSVTVIRAKLPDAVGNIDASSAQAASSVATRNIAGAPAYQEGASSPRNVMCRVQPGDTLSSLAARHLGDRERFQEIYDLNRDVLDGPDQLKVGMLLKLPRTVRPAAAQSGMSTSAASGVPASADGRNPAHSSPPQASAVGRALSQVPPPNYPGFRATPSIQTNSRSIDTGRPVRQHTVRRGETLAGIAQLYYSGDPAALDRLFQANQRLLSSPNAIREGMTLTLP